MIGLWIKVPKIGTVAARVATLEGDIAACGATASWGRRARADANGDEWILMEFPNLGDLGVAALKYAPNCTQSVP
jgi:hypothetical protein